MTFPEEFYSGKLFIRIPPHIASDLEQICIQNGTRMWKPDILKSWIQNRIAENEQIVVHYNTGPGLTDEEQETVSCATMVGAQLFYDNPVIIDYQEMESLKINYDEALDLL